MTSSANMSPFRCPWLRGRLLLLYLLLLFNFFLASLSTHETSLSDNTLDPSPNIQFPKPR